MENQVSIIDCIYPRTQCIYYEFLELSYLFIIHKFSQVRKDCCSKSQYLDHLWFWCLLGLFLRAKNWIASFPRRIWCLNNLSWCWFRSCCWLVSKNIFYLWIRNEVVLNVRRWRCIFFPFPFLRIYGKSCWEQK